MNQKLDIAMQSAIPGIDAGRYNSATWQGIQRYHALGRYRLFKNNIHREYSAKAATFEYRDIQRGYGTIHAQNTRN
jgi:hypothetical protein